MSDAIRHLVVVSDLHAGSAVAICPPIVQLDDEGTYHISKYQAALWDWWQEFWGEWVPRVTGGEPFAVVINGDILEGRHHNTVDPISQNLAIQRRIALDLMKPVRASCERLWIVRGTEAHDAKAGEQVEMLAAELGAEPCGPNHSWWTLDLELGDYRINCAHHIGTTSSAAYESSAVMRELVAALVEAGQWDDNCPDLVVRSHRHRYVEVTMPSKRGKVRGVVTPGWQLHTPFTTRLAGMRRPQIGGLVVSALPGGLVVRAQVWAPKRSEPVGVTPKLTGKSSCATSRPPKKRKKTAPQRRKKS